jgi:hypothetical protein
MSFQYSKLFAAAATPRLFDPCAIDRSKSHSLDPALSSNNVCTLSPISLISPTQVRERTHDEKLFTHILPTNHPPPDNADT